jgi:tRNA(Ile)-lysidine synthase
VLGARRLHVCWGARPDIGPAGRSQAAFDPGELGFPLVFRAWRPGDRIRLAYGTKKVAKLLAEARVPRWKRPTTAVLVEGAGRILWIPGVARSADAVPGPGRAEFHIGVDDADSS